MSTAHLKALRKKHEELENLIHQENTRPAPNDQEIRRLKEQKLHLRDEIEKLQEKE